MRIINDTKILIAIFLTVILTTGMMCGGKKRATIATAVDDFAEAQVSAANLLANAKASGLISQEDINEIKPFLLEANDLNAKAIEYGKKLNQTPDDTTTKDKLVETLNRIAAVLVRANNAGLLRIKNPETRAAFSALVVVMQSAATSIIILVRN